MLLVEPKKYNQDKYGVTLNFAGEPGDAMFAVYDGHGGQGFAAANPPTPRRIADTAPRPPKNNPHPHVADVAFLDKSKFIYGEIETSRSFVA